MGSFILEGVTFPSAGEKPTDAELRAAAALLTSEKKQAPAPFDVLEHQAASAPYEDAPSTAAINLGKAHGVSEYATPIEAGKDLVRGIYDPKRGWFQGSPALTDVGKMPGMVAGGVLAPLSTGDPRQRQLIYAKQVPGAKAVDDKFGRPMIEIDGKRYYTEGTDLDIARAGLGVTGGMAAGAALPMTLPWLIGGGAAIAGGQSAAEDAIARAAGGTNRPWVDPEKLAWSTALGGILPAAISKVPAVAGKLYELAKRGVPMTDEALARAGLSAEQIMSLTGELRDQITSVARRTFGNPNASGAAYRQSLSDEFGVPLTRGELSGDAAQIAREQTLSVPSDVPGRARASQTIQGNRAVQDEKLTLAQQALRAQTGTGRPLRPDEAGTILKGGYETADAQAKAATDVLYGAARDPEAVVAAGGKLAVPASHASQLGQAARTALEADDVGRIVLSEEAGKLTPNARAALAATERWSQRALGPRVDKRAAYSPEGLLGEPPPGATTTRFAMDQPGTVTTYPEIGWKQAEDLRQVLIGYEKKAVAAARAGTGSNQDVAAVKQILQSFDDHLGPLNPLYAPARAAHEARMSTFKPGGSPDQDSATKAVLKALEGPEPGVAVTNTIFGANVKKGAQMIDHLNEGVFANNPEARAAVKEQALRRLVENAHGDPLTPQQQATAIKHAFGDQEGPLYQRLFAGEELARLRRYHELVKTLGEARTKINPPGSGVIMQAVLNARSAANIGTAIGSLPGLLTGQPWLAAAGAGVGRGAGAAIDMALPPIQAARAIRPPPGPRAAPAPAPGPAGAPATPGPVDRLWQGLLGGP